MIGVIFGILLRKHGDHGDIIPAIVMGPNGRNMASYVRADTSTGPIGTGFFTIQAIGPLDFFVYSLMA